MPPTKTADLKLVKKPNAKSVINFANKLIGNIGEIKSLKDRVAALEAKADV